MKCSFILFSFTQMKKTMASEYMGWIANEMQQLKTKLQVRCSFCRNMERWSFYKILCD